MEQKLDLETLKWIKFTFDICSDHSTMCLGYKNLCKRIEELEFKEIKQKEKYDKGLEDAELLIETLNEHRT